MLVQQKRNWSWINIDQLHEKFAHVISWINLENLSCKLPIR